MVAAHVAADVASRRPAALFVAAVGIVLAFTLVIPAEAHALYVYLDPGHGGPYSNANANGLREKTVNLQIALELRSQLQARGHRVGMTRTADRAVGPGDRPTWNFDDLTQTWAFAADGTTRYSGGVPRDDLQARVNRANVAGADLFVSIHNNGSVSRTSRGTETYASGKDQLGMELKTLVHREVVRSTGLRDRGTGTIDFYVLRWSNMPAILVEGAFISNPSDAAFLRTAAGRRAIARGIARGIDAWLATDPYKPVFPRMAGADRYGTAVSVSQQGWPAGADNVIVAGGEAYAEVLCAAPLARKLSAPLLLTDGAALPQSTADELRRLEASSVVVLGGADALSEVVRSQI
ncbi:MAG: hypothetical protein C0418_04680, partial [Coriobacteriaceae bacterium]|nr:hypothetical protein [Coriobacteriaceae bacterium]